ncbi:FHA domain-containing protein [Solirubrobacter taibaiensis]|nr:FHA domain-containing protein [Solirubrobacter taibaiensis]
MSLPFLIYDGPDRRSRTLDLADGPLTIGRRPTCDVALPWDDQVSRLHAELAQIGGVWVVCDDGLSHNGTFLNGDRVRGRRRLRLGDRLTVGSTVLSVCDGDPTSVALSTRRVAASPVRVTPAQRRVLAALCRPLADGGPVPASNHEIAEELVIAVETVKSTLAALFERFGLEHHPRHEKRATLAHRALALFSAEPASR